MKVASIIGARPQFIKSAPISQKIYLSEELQEIIIHTGQHYDKNMSDIFFSEMKIPPPKYKLDINKIKYGTMINNMTEKIVPILMKEEIDGVIVYGDTNSTLSGSLAAKKLNKPIFHVESGLRSFNRNMPEECNRLITDHLSSLLFCPSENAVKNLKNEKINKGVIFVGDIMYETFKNFNFLYDDSSRYKDEFILATIHRRENILSEDKLISIFKNLDKINELSEVIMPVHPHTQKMMNQYRISTRITLIKPAGYFSILKMLRNCKIVITDSGGLQKESYFAKKKCIVVRNETEWVELIQSKTNILSKPQEIFNKYVKILSNDNCDFSSKHFGDGKTSGLIIDSILKYFQNNIK